MSDKYESAWMSDGTRVFRKTVRQFIQAELVPHQARWYEQRHADPEAWLKAGETGMLLPDVPAEYGGGGRTFAYEAVVLEELARAGVHFGSSVQSIVARYVLAHGSEAQKRTWLPRLARGEVVGAVAMTEPAAGSDLQGIQTTARREGDQYVVNGSKTYISSGINADVVVVVARRRADGRAAKGLSLLVVERGMEGFTRGRNLDKVG